MGNNYSNTTQINENETDGVIVSDDTDTSLDYASVVVTTVHGEQAEQPALPVRTTVQKRKTRVKRRRRKRTMSETTQLHQTRHFTPRSTLTSNVRGSDARVTLSEVSRTQISAFVSNMLKDPQQNVWVVPDRVEGALYESAIQIAVGAIAHLLESTRVELLGHEVRFVLSPLDNTTTTTTTTTSNHTN